MKYASLIVVLFAAVAVLGDTYMQNPRGSNDRYNEANENRNNANRLFDSQNNAKGGYCWGPSMTFYEGSLLTVMWTNQHGCGTNNPKLYCNLVIQYMCSKSDDPPQTLVRDGKTTDTIPADAAGVTATDANGDLLYGMHEPLEFYQACETRDRNKGLFVADRREEGGLNGQDATNTRQNNNGGRRGLECPEERDYYPYWAPSPWRDVVILTHDTAWCDFYKKESENVKGRAFCADQNGKQAPPNNEFECKQNNQYTWTKTKSKGIPAPQCLKAPWGRDNHLGSSDAGSEASFNWTLPTANKDKLDCIKKDNCNCVLRLRYNISTLDLGKDGNRPDSGFIDWVSNEQASPVLDDTIKTQDGNDFQLAIDTSQFGRTFQDRSHVFHIKARPSGVSGSNRIFNLNVRGKRGNIVQAYPATEYDFCPDAMDVRVGDYIHFQWTGCDTNPAGNAGEGTAQTDRSNMLQLAHQGDSLPATDEWLKKHKKLFESKELRIWMAFLGQTDCLTYEQLKQIHGANNDNDIETDVKNCMKLNAAPQYFDGGLIKLNTTGTFYYMSARNNNFSNRGQKGQLNVSPLLPTWAVVLVVIGAVFFLVSGVVAGMMLYAKSHPHSGIATAFSKI
jgi:hypothetical protein